MNHKARQGKIRKGAMRLFFSLIGYRGKCNHTKVNSLYI